MDARDRERRSDSYYFDRITRRGLCDRIVTLEEEIDGLRRLVAGLEHCAIEDADAKGCPLYDESEPYRCAKDRAKRELRIDGDSL